MQKHPAYKPLQRAIAVLHLSTVPTHCTLDPKVPASTQASSASFLPHAPIVQVPSPPRPLRRVATAKHTTRQTKSGYSLALHSPWQLPRSIRSALLHAAAITLALSAT